MAGKISGTALAAVGAGALFAYAAIRGKSVTASIQALVQGKDVSALPQANPVTDTTAPVSDAPPGVSGNPPGYGPVGNTGPAKSILQATAAKFGWGSGPEWAALDYVEMREAGYGTHARNASGAYGMAQSLGHPFSGGPAPNGVNEYGGNGLTPAQSRAASMGGAPEQALWMCNYIFNTYGTPVAAAAHERSQNWY